MPTITHENIPDDLCERLKSQAQAHRRSANSGLIHCLETVLRPRKITVEERLGCIRSLRPRIDPQSVGMEEILAAIDEGRP